MKKLTEKNKRFFSTTSKNAIRNRRKRKNKTYKGIKEILSDYNRNSNVIYEKISAPKQFNLKFENCEAVILFINNLKKLGDKKNIQILMDDVVEIGEGAIAMLLSVINEFTSKGISIMGTKPNNKDARSILEKSGFFKYLRTVLSEENANTKNIILRTGDSTTSHNEIATEVRNSMETVWGVNARCPLLVGGIVEMVRNSCDHAFKSEDSITWHLGLSHLESTKLVKYSFVDNGKGIIKTFQKGPLKLFLVLFKDNVDVLQEAFRDGITSRTGLPWRGKGLPTIYEMYTENIISNLIVISNNVYMDFDRKIYVTLHNNFSGTYYYWEVSDKCKKSYFI